MTQEPQLDYLMEKKLQLIVDMSSKKYEQKLAELQRQLDDAFSQIDTLKTNVKNLRSEQSSQQFQPAPQHPQFQQAQPPQQFSQQPSGQDQSLSQQFAQFQQQNSGQQPQQPFAPQGSPQPAQAQQAPPQRNTTTSEKCGGYTSDDVSVEKFFYFGKK